MSLDIYLYGKKKGEHLVEIFETNITHNLESMAREAGIQDVLWRPEKVGAIYAEDIIDAIERGLNLIKSDPKRFEVFNTSNEWGLYNDFIPWIEKYLNACKENPKAIIKVKR